jgi:MoxR-like ATPase
VASREVAEAREPTFADLHGEVVTNIERVIQGKPDVVALVVLCLISQGHLLIEDVPGVGKTSLAKSLAVSIDATFGRLQFTPDLLPTDVVGVTVWNRNSSEFEFRSGPVFNNIVLADEINRASPKTQSALLEAMGEAQVTVDGTTHVLGSPFMVIATQNPIEHEGTYPLPESQLDRFLMRIELGYPEPDAERELLRGGDRRVVLERLEPVADLGKLLFIQDAVDAVQVSEPLIEYVQRLIGFSRRGPDFAFGLSPRGALALLAAARAWALINGRRHVVPEDVQAVLPGVVEHRLRATADFAGHGGGALAQRLLSGVDVVG